ncbi:hypothetical protein BDW60DRAFT_223810 [Aspergillus nidulans var. acristatus]
MLAKMHYPRSSSFSSPSLAGKSGLCSPASEIKAHPTRRMQESRKNSGLVYQPRGGQRRQADPAQAKLNSNQGLAIFSVFEVGMMRSLRFGSGVVVARLFNGTWSAPSAITTDKLTTKGQFGMEHTEFVYVLNNDKAVEAFSQAKSITLGEDASIAVGPFGRSAELAGDAYEADIFAYCKTRAVFGGSTLEGATIGERLDANRKMYQKTVSTRQLLRGEITLPPETYGLMKILHSTWLRPVTKRPSAEKAHLARIVTQQSTTIEPRSRASTIASPAKGENRFYGEQILAPHQITIEITDYSAVQLPSSLTQYEEARESLDSEASSSPTGHPPILKPGRRTWSASSNGGWDNHEPLHF